jgi:hypothetical protein
MKIKYLLLILLGVWLIFLIGILIIKNPFDVCFHMNFIENASDKMTFGLGKCDILLVGKATYSKTNAANETLTVELCEECGIKNDCLGNNLKMLDMINSASKEDLIKEYSLTEGNKIMEYNRLIGAYNLSFADLKEFNIYPLTYSQLNKLRVGNETIYDVYNRYKGSCYQ